MNINNRLNEIIDKYELRKEYVFFKEEGLYKYTDEGWEKKLATINDAGNGRKYHRNLFFEIYITKLMIDKRENALEKIRYRKALFYLTLEMRNFIEAKEVYSSLIETCTEESAKYQNVWNEILALISDIKSALSNKKKEILFYIG